MVYASYFLGAILLIYRNCTPGLVSWGTGGVGRDRSVVSRISVHKTGSGFSQGFERLAQSPAPLPSREI